MAKIQDVAAYICANYPHQNELSKAKVTKLVYLADWKYCQKTNSPLTKIKWRFHNYGPYVEDVIQHISEDTERFVVKETLNIYGSPKTCITLKKTANFSRGLDQSQRKAIDEVISDTASLYWDDFIKHVYHTFPIRVVKKHSILPLIQLAEKERKITAASKLS